MSGRVIVLAGTLRDGMVDFARAYPNRNPRGRDVYYVTVGTQEWALRGLHAETGDMVLSAHGWQRLSPQIADHLRIGGWL